MWPKDKILTQTKKRQKPKGIKKNKIQNRWLPICTRMHSKPVIVHITTLKWPLSLKKDTDGQVQASAYLPTTTS